MRLRYGYVILALALLLVGLGSVMANTYVFTAGNYYLDKIGLDPSWEANHPGTLYDILQGVGASGGFTLAPGNSIYPVTLASISFTDGNNSYITNTVNGSIPFVLTINAITQTINLPWQVTINQSDEAVIFSATTSYFGNLVLTTDAWDSGPIYQNGEYTGNLKGSFTLLSPSVVPEPGFILLLGLGLGAVAVFAYRRF